jgi:flagellum-specific ATP synthase
MKDVTTPQHQESAATIRQLLAAFAEHEDLLAIGAYRRGSNRKVDTAIEMREAIEGLLRQAVDKSLPFDDVVERLNSLAMLCQTKLNAPTTTIA